MLVWLNMELNSLQNWHMSIRWNSSFLLSCTTKKRSLSSLCCRPVIESTCQEDFLCGSKNSLELGFRKLPFYAVDFSLGVQSVVWNGAGNSKHNFRRCPITMCVQVHFNFHVLVCKRVWKELHDTLWQNHIFEVNKNRSIMGLLFLGFSPSINFVWISIFRYFWEILPQCELQFSDFYFELVSGWKVFKVML